MPPFVCIMLNEEKILSVIKSGKCGFPDLPAIMRSAHIPSKERKQLKKTLDGLCARGELICDRSRFGTPEQWGAFKGKVRANAKGFAFISPENGGGDYFVSRRNLKGALDCDEALAFPLRGGSDEAKIIKILSRGRSIIVGRFEKDGRAGYVLPDDKNFLSDVYIPLSLCGGAQSGDKVVCEITSYPQDKMVGGKITDILGKDGDFEAEELGIIKSYNLREQFPEEAVKYAEKQAAQKIEIAGRRDLTSLPTITIDGDDTRDMDDAVSLERIDGGYVLGVHIADVSRYVAYKSATDREAYERGTSVYFPDRVLPMLPESLSNGACSLNEGEPRYALSCIMTFDERGNIRAEEICESVIKSDKRLTYSLADNILEGGNRGSVSDNICKALEDMAVLALLLENKRAAGGGIALDVKEAHIYLDERGEIVIPEAKRTLSQRIIEQFMVAANEAVARFLQKNKAPCLYRVHEPPAPEKAENLFAFLNGLGMSVRAGNGAITPKTYKNILDSAEGKPYYEVVNKVMLRSMSKAKYSQINCGHFGLASKCYCHFTSPIRRYPDLFVHRAVKGVLRGDGNALNTLARIAEETAARTSEAERVADGAERDVDELYKVVYMSDKLGEIYDAVISGVTAFGIFAELPNAVEGLIRLENLPRDNYFFYEDKLLLKGAKHAYRIGDGVKIKVAGCDYGNMRVQFALV